MAEPIIAGSDIRAGQAVYVDPDGKAYPMFKHSRPETVMLNDGQFATWAEKNFGGSASDDPDWEAVYELLERFNRIIRTGLVRHA